MPLHDKYINEMKDKRKSKIDLSNLGLEDEDVVTIANLLAENNVVSDLNLERNNISSAAFAELAKCIYLKELNLTNNHIHGDNIEALFTLPNLATLNLSDNKLSLKAGEKILQHLNERSSLLTINVVGNDKIPLELQQKIDQQMRKLRDQFGEQTKPASSSSALISYYKQASSSSTVLWKTRMENANSSSEPSALPTPEKQDSKNNKPS